MDNHNSRFSLNLSRPSGSGPDVLESIIDTLHHTAGGFVSIVGAMPCARPARFTTLHSSKPDIFASTLYTTAKSCSASPIARAAVRYSLLAATVGSGTLS